ncbi:MAG: phage shock protein E [Psychroserpens sp.]|jgi:phage shock protein E
MKFIKSALVILLSVCAFLTFAEQTATISQQTLLSLMATPTNKTVMLYQLH